MTQTMDRGSGVALWRQIADRIRHTITTGQFPEGDKLPPEIALAESFGVNRHTVRSAIAALVQEGVLRAEQGRGTFVEHGRRISYAVGRRTRFSTNLEGQARHSHTVLRASSVLAADAAMAATLGIAPGAAVLQLDTLAQADGRPLSCATHWFDAARFDGLAATVAATGSITTALARHGVADYLRRATTITARHADAAELALLALAPGAIVLATSAINEDAGGTALQLSETLFAADRVELTISGDA